MSRKSRKQQDEWTHEDTESEKAQTLLAQRAASEAIRNGTLSPAERSEATSVALSGCPYSRDEIDEMQLLGVPKPAEVTWGDWVGPKDLSHRHDYFIQLAASGITNNEIAERLGMSVSRVCILLKHSEIKTKIKALQQTLWGEGTQKRFNQILGEAITVAHEVLKNPGAGDRLRADVAFRFMDRSLGKPKQEVSVEGNLLADFLLRLDQKESSANEEKLVSSEKDEVDEFVDDFVPHDFTIGKRTGGYE